MLSLLSIQSLTSAARAFRRIRLAHGELHPRWALSERDHEKQRDEIQVGGKKLLSSLICSRSKLVQVLVARSNPNDAWPRSEENPPLDQPPRATFLSVYVDPLLQRSSKNNALSKALDKKFLMRSVRLPEYHNEAQMKETYCGIMSQASFP
jgi:hypothetical protein